jgi:hypothetical protein
VLNVTSSNELLKYIEYAHVIGLAERFKPEFKEASRKSFGFLLEEILFQCQFDENDCLNYDSFTKLNTYSMGDCFQFNSGFDMYRNKTQLKYSIIPGEKNGLNLIFFLGVTYNKYTAASSNGLRIFIHNSSFFPYLPEVIEVMPGTMTNIGIKRTFTYKYPYPYSECIDLSEFESELYNFFKKTNKTYRQRDCFDLCLQKIVIEKCKCYYLDYPKLIDSAEPCIGLDQLICVADQYEHFLNHSFKAECSIQCPLECNSETFDFLISYSDFPSEAFYNLYASDKSFVKAYFPDGNVSYRVFKERSIGINIFYPQFNFWVITELQKITMIDLISNIGATLGLFLGLFFFLYYQGFVKVFFQKGINSEFKTKI